MACTRLQRAFLDVRSIWGETLWQNPVWKSAVVRWLQEIRASGTAGALQNFLEMGGQQ